MHAEAHHLLHTSLEQVLGAEPAVILMDALTACATKDDLRELGYAIDRRVVIVDERLAALKEAVQQQFEQVDRRFEQVDRRFEEIDRRFEEIDRRFEEVDRRLEHVDERLQQVDTRLGRIETQLDTLNGNFADLLRDVHLEMRKTTQTLFFQLIAFAFVVFVAAGVVQR